MSKKIKFSFLPILITAGLLCSGVSAATDYFYVSSESLSTRKTLNADKKDESKPIGSSSAKWQLKDGVLTISGTGPMPNFNFEAVYDEDEVQKAYEEAQKDNKSVDIEKYVEYKNDLSPFFKDRDKIKKIVIKSGITVIGSDAFPKCPNLTTVEIAGTVKIIGKQAFAFCPKLTDVTIPSGVTIINDAAFSGCSSLTSFTFPDAVSVVSESVLANCDHLSKVTLPAKATEIKDTAFSGCSALTSINIPETVKSIGSDAFSECKKLVSVTLPRKVTVIANGLFSNCTNLSSVSMTEGVTKIGQRAFENTALTSMVIPSETTSIGAGAFSECKKLKTITIPSSVSVIGAGAFSECSDELVIECVKGSEAHSYAIEWNIKTNVKEEEAIPGSSDDIKPPSKNPKSTVRALKPMKIRRIRTGNKRVKVVWNKVKNATGYTIRYSRNKKMSGSSVKTVNVPDVTKNYMVISGLNNDQLYYFQIRYTVVRNGETVTSEWSRPMNALLSSVTNH